MSEPSHPFGAAVEGPTQDYTWLGPSFECLCGSNLFYILCVFDPDTRLVGFYFTDGMCAACGALVKMPTEVDEVPFTHDMPARTPDSELAYNLMCPTCGDDNNVIMNPDGWAACDGIVCTKQRTWKPALRSGRTD